MLLINISSDQVLFAGEDLYEILPYQDLERTFPKRFLELVREYDVNKIAVINGPGSFTSLRIGSICINTHNNLVDEEKKLKILDISKLDLINFAQSKGYLPSVSILFMGMRKKMRCTKDGKELVEVTKETVVDYIDQKGYVIDWIQDHPVKDSLDKSYAIEKIGYTQDGLSITYMDQAYVLPREKVGTWKDELSPRYMMEPILN